MLTYAWLGLHAEMKEGLLSDEADYASRPLRDKLKRMVALDGSIRWLTRLSRCQQG
jgi:hypothetical protein